MDKFNFGWIASISFCGVLFCSVTVSLGLVHRPFLYFVVVWPTY